MTFAETGCLRFVWALNRARRQHMLTQHSLADFNAMRCYLSEDERTGFAITEDRELTCLFNVGTPGNGALAVLTAVDLGARHFNFFDTPKLRAFYARVLGTEVNRVPFDPRQAPEGWPDEEGTPDVVFMVLS